MFLFRGFTKSPALAIRGFSQVRPGAAKSGCLTAPAGGLLRQDYTQKTSLFVFRRGFRLKKGSAPEQRATTKPKPEFTHPVEGADVQKWSRLGRPLVFAVGFSGLSFGLASIWQYENMRQYAHARKSHIRKKAGDLWREWSTNTPQDKAGAWRRELNSIWNSLSEGQKVFAPICAANVAVFAMWRIPALAPFMMKYFVSNPAVSNKGLPMILSAFSHQTPLHLFCNMFVLHSFSTPVVQALGKEQFVGLYFSSAVVSCFASSFAKVMMGRANGFSLGASGAICAVLGLFSTINPDATLQIIFLPMITFTASTAIKAMIALDTCGLIAGWQVFDHACHLGGVLMGIWWYHNGHKLVWENRAPLMNYWHELRQSVEKSRRDS